MRYRYYYLRDNETGKRYRVRMSEGYGAKDENGHVEDRLYYTYDVHLYRSRNWVTEIIKGRVYSIPVTRVRSYTPKIAYARDVLAIALFV